MNTSLATELTQRQREDMELRCRVCNINISCHKLGNKARNVNKPGALHTPSLRLDFLAQLFVSRQKVEKENELKLHMALTSCFTTLQQKT